jgi:hypothetical protein
MKSIEDKLLGQLYCFCSGGDDTGGGSAGDFDDSYNKAMGYTDSKGKATGTGGESDPARTESGAIARTSNYDSQIEAAARAAAGGGDYTNVFAGDIAAYNDMQRGLAGQFSGYGGSDLEPSVGGTGPRFDTTTPVQGSPRDMGQGPRFVQGPSIAGAMTRGQMLGAPRPSAPEDTELEFGEDVDIFDTAYTGGATPVQQVQAASGVQAPPSVSPNDDYNYPGIAGPAPTPRTAADLGFVQQPSTPMTEEERAKAQRELNTQDLNKDGKISDTERTIAAQGFGLVGLLSDVGRRMSIGDPNAGLDYESEAYGVSSRGIGNDDDDGDEQAAPAVTAPVAPATCPPGYRFNEKTNACEYVGQVYPGATPYSGPPIAATTQYTGIGGLSPFVLQPSYTPQTPFAPLYNVG